MRKLLVLLLIGCLSSCTRLEYGNFTNASLGAYELMAKDASAQLVHLYPPAKNQFRLLQKIQDPFGVRLIELLRKKGFGVIENINTTAANFFYVVDEPVSNHLYRVSVFVEGQSLSRIYRFHNRILVPVGPWSWKE